MYVQKQRKTVQKNSDRRTNRHRDKDKKRQMSQQTHRQTDAQKKKDRLTNIHTKRQRQAGGCKQILLVKVKKKKKDCIGCPKSAVRL